MAERSELIGLSNGWTIIGSMSIIANLLSPQYLVHPLIAAILLISGVGLRAVAAMADKTEPREQNLGNVRALLVAMREPTEAQYEALCATGKMWRELDSRTVWTTYIDALLANPQTQEPGVTG